MGTNNKRLSITQVARTIGVTPRTIMRWEKAGKIKKSKRDWRGWRFYHEDEVEEIRKFYETVYEYEDFNGSTVNVVKDALLVLLALTGLIASLIVGGSVSAGATSPGTNFDPQESKVKGVVETPNTVDIILDELPVVETSKAPITEAVKYTLGPNDVISIEVRRHPEFDGQYPINSEGKIEYKYVGDVIVSGLTKTEVKERLTQILSEFIIEPEVDVQIVAYLSKVYYVVGEVGRPGKFYMKGDTTTVREALVEAALPTHAAAMRRCRLIAPNNTGTDNYVEVNVYKLIYEGDLSCNLEMKSGNVLYVPATAMAKLIRVISPVTGAVGQTAGVAAAVPGL